MTVIVAILKEVKRWFSRTGTVLASFAGGKAMAENDLAAHRVLAPPKERAA